MVDLGWNKSAFKSDKFDDKNLKLIHYKINWKPWHYDNVYYEEFFWKYAQKTFLYDNILKIKAGYTEDLHERDNLAFENLVKMAVEDSNDPNNYCNSTKAKK